jgi:uncharacterized protein
MTRLPFLDRSEEQARLRRLLGRREGALAVLHGRRRCGKSRLLREVLDPRRSVYFVGDERESILQRAAFAAEVARLIPGFARVTYPDWDAVFGRLWEQAPPGAAVAIDEFPALVTAAREIPGLLQKQLDRHTARGPRLLLTGSSQRMMQGLVLDRTAPLYGRATEILKVGPLAPGWIQKALRPLAAIGAVEAYSVWGGIPRYWELAADFATLDQALADLVLSPLGVLHDEPVGLLLDDTRDVAQAASILSLIGQGCHRLSEIAARLGKPATSLSRPMQRLVDLELVRREIPFGALARDSKRTLYRIADPFLAFWFRFVEPQRSRLEAGQVAQVVREVKRDFSRHASGAWEELARASVSHMGCFDRSWKPAARWWGPGLDRTPMEVDLVAESADGSALLLGEAQWTDADDVPRLMARLRRKAENFPLAGGREVCLGLWLKKGHRGLVGGEICGPTKVLRALL